LFILLNKNMCKKNHLKIFWNKKIIVDLEKII
jgi:hypothetical protein